MPVPRSTSNKSIRDKVAQKDHAHDHTLPQGRSQPTLAVAMIHHNLQQVGIKPWVQEGTQLDLPVKNQK
jgi:hypothetical protein